LTAGSRRQRYGALSKFDGDNLPPALALQTDPAILAGIDPMDAATPRYMTGVADSERVAIVLGVRHRDA
jgi:hypothetical protein